MRTVLVLYPQRRDADEVRAAGLDRLFDVRWHGTDLDAGGVPDLGADDVPPHVDAVVGTKDRSALAAACLASGRPGPSPRAVIACQHKPTSRAIQRKAVPEAVPRFALLGHGTPPFAPPYFVKPVVGRLSQNARRVDDVADLAATRGGGDYAAGWAELAACAGFKGDHARGFIVEECVLGDEVTLEGYVHAGRVTVIGITDSVKYEGTNSFERFEYPSRLDVERQAELRGVACTLLPALGFDGGFFNVEFIVPAAGPAKIVEVNARIASQFAPLVRALHGRSTYDALFSLALGDDPDWGAGSPDGVAVSFVMRAFADARVVAVPETEDGLEVLVEPGRWLSEQSRADDVASYRLAILYEAGETRAEAVTRARERARRLAFVFDS